MRDAKERFRQLACFVAISVSPIAASGDTLAVANTATATYTHEAANNPPAARDSNTVVAVIEIPPPTIRFYRNDRFIDEAFGARAGDSLYLQARAAGFNNDPFAVESLQIAVTSLNSGDVETFVAMETQSNSALFRVMEPIRTRISSGGASHDGLLDLAGADRIQATVANAARTLLIDPVGTVFDSETNAPIGGATVRLIDLTGAGNGGAPGQDARVFDFDGVTVAPSAVITDALGAFQFPLVAPSEYRLLITPPGDYTFPSTLDPAQWPAARILNLPGSYGGAFPVNEETGLVMIDAPLDASPSGLAVQKTVSRASAGIAETVQYSIAISNLSGLPLTGVELRDTLPAGFAFVPGSARVDGERIDDPAGGKGPRLTFTLDALTPDARPVLTYRVAIGPGALQGDGVNSAQLFSALPARKRSNVSRAEVKVQGGVFDDRAYVLGKVFTDCNKNGVQDAGEAGVPRVRLYMEDGGFVMTDLEGKFSFYGVTPRTHVLKVDATTLPAGVTLAPLAHRHAGDGDTRFLDVQRSELHRADFATAGCTLALREAIDARRSAGAAFDRELELGLTSELSTDEAAASLGDVRALPASGVVGEPHGVRTGAAPAAAAPTDAQAAPAQTLQGLLPALDRRLGFIGVADHDVLGVAQTTLRVKGAAHATLELRVNGALIDASRIGARLTDAARRIQVLEFVGVDLKAGENLLSLAQTDADGNLQETVTLRIVAAGRIARLSLDAPAHGVPADGEQTAVIRIEAQDVDGTHVASRIAMTLEASAGEWQVEDLDDDEPGTQTFMDDGRAEVLLRAPLVSGSAKVRVSAAGAAATAQVAFTAALRPLLGVGLVEGTLNFRKLSANALVPARGEDGFERELRQGAADAHSGGARAALFLKGKIRGDYLLTLGYDSDKDTSERLFRDIQPDRFYPVYGDSSIKGYDAQSTGRLYVRVDRNKSYLLGGDITTQSLSPVRRLGAYNRSLTGVKEHFDAGAVAIDAFASHDSTSQLIEELPANGTSGPFFLSNQNAIENSELIEVLTRDRDQPAIIVHAAPQQRFVDYEIEPLSGRLLFRRPIPSVDEDLNPVSIRITYEVDQGGDEFWTTGVDTQVQMTERLALGAAVIDDRNPQDARRISSINTTVRFSEATELLAEAARTRRDLTGNGRGERIELNHKGAALQVRAFGARTDENFDNPSASISAGRSEAGAKGGYSLTQRSRLIGEVLHSAEVDSDAQRNGALLGFERSFARNVKAELGVRHVRDERTDASGVATTSAETTSVRTKLSVPLPMTPRASVFGEYEQDIDASDSRVLAAGGAYQLANRSRLYARHELISSLGGPYELDPTQKRTTTVFGVDTTYWRDDHLFSEYRIGDALSGREAQAALGLRNAWRVAPGVRLNTSFERVDALSGGGRESSALTGAVEYTRNPLWKATARLELRDSADSEGVLSTLGLAYKLTDDWTALAKNVFALSDNEGAQPDRTQDRFQIGAAYRDGATNRINALTRYEFKYEKGVELGLQRTVHIISAHADLQATRATLLRGQYAGKLVSERIDGLRIHNGAHLLAGRATHDLGARWDAGVHLRALINKNFDGYQGGVGAEVGYLIRDNLWVSAGYNVLGFRDEDLAADEYTSRGGYLRLRFKFDESFLGALR